MPQFKSQLSLLVVLAVLTRALGFVDNNPDLPFKSANARNLDWPSAKEVQRRLPYYLAGHSKSGSPVWYVEFGKWDLHEMVETDKGFDLAVQHAREMSERASRVQEASLPDKPRDKFTTINNMNGFNLKQLLHMPTIQFYMNGTKHFVEILQRDKCINKIYFINANPFFLTMYNMLSPILTPISQHIEVYGTDPEQWKPVLLSQIHRDQLPEAVGGSKKKQPFLQKYD